MVQRVNYPDMQVTKRTNKSGKPILRGSQAGKIHNDMKKKVKKTIKSGNNKMHIVSGKVAEAYNIDKSIFEISNKNLSGITTVKSCAVLAPVFNRNTASLEIQCRVPLHPQTINSYRLQQLAELYASYRFKKITLKWCPRVATSLYGSIAVFYVDDPTNIIQTSTYGSSDTMSQVQTESIIIESEHRFLGPIWEPAVLTRANFHNESQNPWFRTGLTSGAILDEVQGLLMIAAGGTSTEDTELGIVEIEYEIEFCHPVSPVKYQTTGNPNGGYTLDLGVSASEFAVHFQSDTSGTYNYWVNNQGLYLATCNKDNTSVTAAWAIPAKIGACWFIKINCGMTKPDTTTLYSTSFTFYNSYAAYLSDDILESTTEAVTTNLTLNKINMYKIGDANIQMSAQDYATPSAMNFRHDLEEAKKRRQICAKESVISSVSTSSSCDSVTSKLNHSINDYYRLENLQRR